MHKLLGLGMAVVLSAATAACGVQDAPPALASLNWSDRPWMQQAGTPLVSGLTVPAGAELIGPVFTLLEAGKVDHQAAYLIAEEPLVAASGFAEQDALPSSTQRHGPCTQTRYEGEQEGGGIRTRTEPFEGDLLDDALRVDCAVYFVLVEANEEQGRLGRGVSVDLWQDVDPPSATGQGTVRWDPPPLEVPDALPVAPVVTDGPTTVPSDVEGDPDLEIVPGSFLAGPPFPGSGTGGYVAVIGVSGNPDQVFDAYASQRSGTPIQATAKVDDMRVRVADFEDAGGVHFTVTLNEIEGNAWILVEAYND